MKKKLLSLMLVSLMLGNASIFAGQASSRVIQHVVNRVAAPLLGQLDEQEPDFEDNVPAQPIDFYQIWLARGQENHRRAEAEAQQQQQRYAQPEAVRRREFGYYAASRLHQRRRTKSTRGEMTATVSATIHDTPKIIISAYDYYQHPSRGRGITQTRTVEHLIEPNDYETQEDYLNRVREQMLYVLNKEFNDYFFDYPDDLFWDMKNAADTLK